MTFEKYPFNDIYDTKRVVKASSPTLLPPLSSVANAIPKLMGTMADLCYRKNANFLCKAFLILRILVEY